MTVPTNVACTANKTLAGHAAELPPSSVARRQVFLEWIAGSILHWMGGPVAIMNARQCCFSHLPARDGASRCLLVQLVPRPRVPTELTLGCVDGA